MEKNGLSLSLYWIVTELTCDDSDDAGVELVFVGGAFVFVGKALPACEGG